jgi:hypothetical protein
MISTVDQWREILKGLHPADAAKRILTDITHYQRGRAYERDDVKQLAAALVAYASSQKM